MHGMLMIDVYIIWKNMKFKKYISETKFKKKLNKIKTSSKKQYSHKKLRTESNHKKIYNENDFSFMNSMENLINKNQKKSSESVSSMPDISSSYWVNLISQKKEEIQTKIKNHFDSKKNNIDKNKKYVERGRLMLPNEIKVEHRNSFTKETYRTPKNFSSKKHQLRISKSNNINKKYLNESIERKKKKDFGVVESHKKRIFGSSCKKKQSDKRERMKSEIPAINSKLQKVEKKFSTRFSNCLPFPEKLYKLIGVLGKGSYGLVFLAIHLISGQKVAIKAIKKNRNNDILRNYEKISNEIDIFANLNHKNIISLYEVFENRKYIFLVTEYAEKGNNNFNLFPYLI
jgi:serine/threonine protein kinase